MRLTLTRHGGFAGLRLPPIVLDTADLTPAAADKLERLIALIDPSSTNESAPKADAPPQADRFSYTLTIGKKKHTFNEATASQILLDVVRAVQQIAKK